MANQTIEIVIKEGDRVPVSDILSALEKMSDGVLVSVVFLPGSPNVIRVEYSQEWQAEIADYMNWLSEGLIDAAESEANEE